jgi:hypothetical protein
MLELDTSKLKMVILECPFKNWQNQLTRDLFNEVIQLKIDGYETRWGAQTMAMDATDFISDHLLICQENAAGKLTVLSASKSITLSTSNAFHLPFMPVTMLENSNETKTHLSCLDEILKKATAAKKEIAYYSSWTIHPDIRKNRASSALIKDIFTALSVDYHRGYNIQEMLGFSVPQFKTDIVFAAWGYKNVKLEGKELSSILLPRYNNAEVRFIHLDSFSMDVMEVASKYSALWANRLTVKGYEDAAKVA